jgi:hypothetical protein
VSEANCSHKVDEEGSSYDGGRGEKNLVNKESRLGTGETKDGN